MCKIFNQYNYEGSYIDICGKNNDSITNLQNILQGFEVKSLQSSYTSIFLFYKKIYYEGDVFPIGKGIMIPTIKRIDFKDGFKFVFQVGRLEKILHNIYYNMGSVLFQKDYCLYMTIITNESNTMREICSDIKYWNFGIAGNGKWIVLSENGSDIQKDIHRDYFMETDKITSENLYKYQHFGTFRFRSISENEEYNIEEYSIMNDLVLDIRFSISEDMTVEIYEKPYFEGFYSILDYEYQKTNKRDLKGIGFKDIGSIKVTYKYQAHGYLCKKEAGTNEIIRLNKDEIECFSLNRQTCEMVNDMTDIECVEFINQNILNSKPLNCADEYMLEYNEIAYNINGHWCDLGRKYYGLTPSYLQDD